MERSEQEKLNKILEIVTSIKEEWIKKKKMSEKKFGDVVDSQKSD